MTIELLYFDGCPTHEPLLARVSQLLAGAREPRVVALVKIESEAAAEEARFLGSPTLRVDGRDVEPGAEKRADFGLKCRLYRTAGGLSGLPADDWILAALGQRQEPESPSAITEPDRQSPTARLIADRSAKDRLESSPPTYRRLRQRVLGAFLDGAPPRAQDLERWCADLDVPADEALSALERNDVLARHPHTGDVTVAYPFSAVATAHTVRLDGAPADVFAMCAIDALGVPFLAGRPGRIRSRDPHSGDSIEVTIDPAARSSWEPDEAVVLVGVAGGGPSARCCCPHINFASDRRSAHAALGDSREVDGTVLEMPEAIEVGRRLFGRLLDDAG